MLPAKTNGEVALSPDQEKKLALMLSEIPKAKQFTWLQLSNVKSLVTQQLTNKELELQKLLIGYDKLDVAALQKAIDAYAAGKKAIPDIRKTFTKYLERMGQDLMVFEKRVEGYQLAEEGKGWVLIPEHPWPLAQQRLLTLKEAEEAKSKGANARAEELAAFKTHVANEKVRIRTEYEKALLKTIDTAYSQALDQELTEDGLKQYVKVTEAALVDVKLQQPLKFEGYKLYNRDNETDRKELMEAAAAIVDSDYKKILSAYVEKMRGQFNLYFSDKANAEKAKDFLKGEHERRTTELDNQASNKMAVNQLMNKGATATATLVGNPEIKPIKRKWIIVIQDEDSAWSKKVISEFLARWNTCAPRLKVTKWSNLTVKQMAQALQEEEEQIPGFRYTEVKK